MNTLTNFIKLLTYWFLLRKRSGYLTQKNFNPETKSIERNNFSPYFEFEQWSIDEKIMVRVVITLGTERLPSDSLDQHFQQSLENDGLIARVTEIYFINVSNHDVNIKANYISLDQHQLKLGEAFVIAPQHWGITQPLIDMTITHHFFAEIEVTYEYLGNEYQIKGCARRKTVEEISEKYRMR